MSEVTTIGMDLAKQVNHIVGVDKHQKGVVRKKLRRRQVLAYFANLPPCTIAMEACSGAHEWGRQLEQQGHRVLLISAKLVRAYVQGNKNDYNDAWAILEAARRPNLRPVPIKTRAQQELQALHRMRQARVSDCTALTNQLRGLLAEFGIVMPQGKAALRRRLPEILEDGDNGLSMEFRHMLDRCRQQLVELEEHIEFYTTLIKRRARECEAQQRLQSAPGFGPIVASAFHGAVGDGSAFRRGRDVSVSVGLVPAQHSSGDKPRLLGISKRGDKYLRSLLVHAARSLIKQAPHKDDALSRWTHRLMQERGINKATVALANKLARIGWAILRYGQPYQPIESQAVPT